MGQAKQFQMDQEDKLIAAEEVAVRADYLNRCDAHDELYDACSVDIVNTYKLGASLFKAGDPLVAIFNSQIELTDMLKGLENMYQDACPSCERAMKD